MLLLPSTTSLHPNLMHQDERSVDNIPVGGSPDTREALGCSRSLSILSPSWPRMKKLWIHSSELTCIPLVPGRTNTCNAYTTTLPRAVGLTDSQSRGLSCKKKNHGHTPSMYRTDDTVYPSPNRQMELTSSASNRPLQSHQQRSPNNASSPQTMARASATPDELQQAQQTENGQTFPSSTYSYRHAPGSLAPTALHS